MAGTGGEGRAIGRVGGVSYIGHGVGGSWPVSSAIFISCAGCQSIKKFLMLKSSQEEAPVAAFR